MNVSHASPTTATPATRSARVAQVLEIAVPLLVFAGVSVAALEAGGHLLFHILAELGSVIVGLMAVTVALLSRRFTRNHFVVFISLGLGWCALIDLAHMLTYRGMPFAPAGEANVATQLWLLARFLQAATLLLAPAFLSGPIPAVPVTLGFAAYTVIGVSLVFGGHLPAAFVEGEGLTTFKIVAEYVVIAMLAGALALLWRHRSALPGPILGGVAAAIGVMILSEYCFTQYRSTDAVVNAVGHFLKVVAYWFIFVALVQTTLRTPFRMLARTASTYDAVPQPVLVVGADGRILQANRAAAAMAGTVPDVLAGRGAHDYFHAAGPAQRCPVCTRIGGGEVPFSERVERGGRSYECHVAPVGDRQAHVEVLHDVTDTARLDLERAGLAHALGERRKELRCLHELGELSRRPGLDVPQALAAAVALLPPAFLHPAQARAQIFSEWGAFGALDAVPHGRSLEQPLMLSGRKVGSVRVFYPAAADLAGALFLPEETALLQSYAAQLGDLVGHMLAAERVQRLTHLYAMLSGTNRAVVHAEDVDALLGQVFGVLIRHGAFPVVMILRADDGGLPMRVAHRWGLEDAALPALEARIGSPASAFARSLRDPEAGRIEFGMLPAPATDPACEGNDWLQHLHAQGLRQYGVIRLAAGERALGLIVLYTRSRLGFEPDELRLLEEMAMDIAFGLQRLEERGAHEAARQRANAMEFRFRGVFDHSPVPMMVVSRAQGELREMNRALEEWLGYRREEVGSIDRWFELVYDDPVFRRELREVWTSHIVEAAREGTNVASPPLRMRRKDGTLVKARGRMTVVGDDIILAWVEEGEA